MSSMNTATLSSVDSFEGFIEPVKFGLIKNSWSTNNSWKLSYSLYYVPDTVPSSATVSTHLLITAFLSRYYYYPFLFSEKEIEHTERWKYLPKATQALGGVVKIQTQGSWPQSPCSVPLSGASPRRGTAEMATWEDRNLTYCSHHGQSL